MILKKKPISKITSKVASLNKISENLNSYSFLARMFTWLLKMSWPRPVHKMHIRQPKTISKCWRKMLIYRTTFYKIMMRTLMEVWISHITLLLSVVVNVLQVLTWPMKISYSFHKLMALVLNSYPQTSNFVGMKCQISHAKVIIVTVVLLETVS